MLCFFCLFLKGGFIDYNWLVNDMATYTIEGRGPNFIISPDNIIPSGQENYEGFREMIRTVVEEVLAEQS